MFTKLPRIVLAALALALCASSPVKADDWKFEATPYFWAAGLNGNIDTPNRSVSFDQSFNDLLEMMNFGAMGRFEAKHDELILTTDLMFINLGESGSAGPIDVSANIRQTILEFGGGYHLADFVLGDSAPTLSIDALAGARYFRLKSQIRGPFGKDPGSTIDYWEPYVGPRVTLAFNDRWSLGLRTDIGGFGIGNAPRTSWQMSSGVKYQATKSIAVDLGYKLLRIYDLDQKNTSADVYFGGLVLAATFGF